MKPRWQIFGVTSLAACLTACLMACLMGGCRPAVPPVQGEGPRIVSLAPNLTEFVCAVGGEQRLVGRSSACDYPPGLQAAVPVAGGFGRPNLEALLLVRPTLVLTSDLEDESVISVLEKNGIRHERIVCAQLEELPAAALRIGELAEADSGGRQLAETLGRGLFELRARLARVPAPTVFVELWSEPLMTAGRNAFVADVVRLAGGHNLGDEITERDYFTVSSEWVLMRDPDIIICLDMTADDAQPDGTYRSARANARLAARPGWSGLRAVREGRVYAGFDNDLILRAGPRALAGAALLAAAIQSTHGEAALP